MTPRALVAATVLALGLGLLGGAPARADDACPQPDRAAYGHRLRYDTTGRLLPSCDGALREILAAAAGVSDVIVFSHGWMNDPVSAEGTYARFISGMLARRPAGLDPGFRPLLVGVYWPSAVFPVSGEGEESMAATVLTESDLVERIRRTFDWLEGVPDVDPDLHDVARLVAKEIRGEPRTRAEFLLLANILKRWSFFAGPGSPAEGTEGEVEAPGERPLLQLEVGDLAQFLLDNSYAGGGEESLASRVASVLSVLNVFTFWEMKRRAGEIGESGVHDFLAALKVANPRTRLHLVGHSFGGKLLFAAVSGKRGATPVGVDSVVILQGAFSHFALSREADLRDLPVQHGGLTEGRYASVAAARAVHGPVVFTYSTHDVPNGVWYPLGVRVSGDTLEKREQTPTVYGAMGADGAQRAGAQAIRLRKGLPVALPRPTDFTVINVEATEVIPGHSKFFAPEVYDLVWAMLR